MDMFAFTGALKRRWYLVVLSLALAGAAAFLAVGRVGPTYEVEGSVLLFPPSTTIDSSGDTAVTMGNPYLYLGGLNPARDILMRASTSRAARDSLEDLYPGADYGMESDVSNAGPVIVVDVTGETSAEAVAALTTLLDGLPATLQELQSGLDINKAAFISSRVLTADTRPEVVHKSQIRAGIVAGAGVIAVLILLIGLLDGLLLARAARRREKLEQEQTPALKLAKKSTSEDASSGASPRTTRASRRATGPANAQDAAGGR